MQMALRQQSLAPESHRPPVQAKARIGPVDDPLEREADSVADAVVAGRPIGPIGGTPAAMMQRECAGCAMQDEEMLQREALSSPPASGSSQHAVEGAAQSVSTGGVPLTAAQRAYFEPRFRRDFSNVRLHFDAASAETAQSIDARAYTLGSHIAFAPGQYAPGSHEGDRLLAHELTHVSQQAHHGPFVQRQPVRPTSPLVDPGFSFRLKILRLTLLMCGHSRMREAFEMIARDGIQLIGFRTAYDTWRYDDGRVEEVTIPGLRGNTRHAQKEIRLNEALGIEAMAETLFHELQHWAHRQDPAGPRGLESEIQARIATEELAIERGRPPTRAGYRTADGRVDEAAIRRDMAASPHYSPTGRTRIGRRYEGETPITDPPVCPLIGDFPEPSAVRAIA
jgi:hypothetical protein